MKPAEIKALSQTVEEHKKLMKESKKFTNADEYLLRLIKTFENHKINPEKSLRLHKILLTRLDEPIKEAISKAIGTPTKQQMLNACKKLRNNALRLNMQFDNYLNQASPLEQTMSKAFMSIEVGHWSVFRKRLTLDIKLLLKVIDQADSEIQKKFKSSSGRKSKPWKNDVLDMLCGYLRKECEKKRDESYDLAREVFNIYFPRHEIATEDAVKSSTVRTRKAKQAKLTASK